MSMKHPRKVLKAEKPAKDTLVGLTVPRGKVPLFLALFDKVVVKLGTRTEAYKYLEVGRETRYKMLKGYLPVLVAQKIATAHRILVVKEERDHAKRRGEDSDSGE